MSPLFIFDMDQVLYTYNWEKRMAGLTEVTGHSLEELRRRWWHAEGEIAAEAGGFASPEAYLVAFNEAMGIEVSRADWVRFRATAMTPTLDAHDAVRRAAELGRVTLLTNNGPLSGAHLHEIAPELVDIFGEHLYASAHYGARKPDPVVFERVLERYATPAENAFFADDLPENVTGAASIGITAHLFEGAVGMLAAIEQFAAERAESSALHEATATR
ncbi:MAG: HAD family hydrolase [Microbacteriaceae bacterium]